MIRTKIIILGFLLIAVTMISACDYIQLPQADYANEVEEYLVPVYINYQHGNLRVKDSIIEDFSDFLYSYVAYQPGFEYNLRHCLLALSMDRDTPFSEIDSILRVFNQSRFFRVFFLVNNIEDSIGYTMPIPFYSYRYPENYNIPDTIVLDNLIELKENKVYINGEQTDGLEIDLGIREIIYNKEAVALKVDRSTKYESMIEILEGYHKYRQHFKQIYSELNFNKKYHWLLDPGGFKWEVDDEYRSRIFLFDTSNISTKTIKVKNDHTVNYAP